MELKFGENPWHELWVTYKTAERDYYRKLVGDMIADGQNCFILHAAHETLKPHFEDLVKAIGGRIIVTAFTDSILKWSKDPKTP